MGLAGFPPAGAQPGWYCSSTVDAVQAFQRDHGLAASGQCDDATWLALVESSWRLGDRSLRITAPRQRGDDVVSLQTALARLGFDPGHVDGVFGPDTAEALVDFQRNVGLDDDGVCGPFTVRALEVNAARSGTGPGVVSLREIVRLDDIADSLAGLRLVVGQFGGLAPLARHLAHELRHHRAMVVVADQPDAAGQADAANGHGASVYLGFESRPETITRVAHYATQGFESAGGKALAGHLARTLADVPRLAAPEVAGLRLPVLRATRMTAVVCSLGPVQRVTDAAPAICAAVVDAVSRWTRAPVSVTP